MRRRAISLVWRTTGRDLQTDFVRQLTAVRSWRTGVTGAALDKQLAPVAPSMLPSHPKIQVPREPSVMTAPTGERDM